MTTATITRSEAAARVRAEGLVRLDQAAAMFAAHNVRGHVSARTLQRWIISGKRGVKLDGARQGGVWHTSLAALLRFRQAVGL